jgi:fucose permease
MGALRIAIAIIGFGGGIINGGTNALVADISTEGKHASLNLLGVFFGIGAVGVPFALAMTSGQFSSASLIAGVGALVAIPFLYIAITPFPAPKHDQGFPIAAAGALLREPLLLLMGVMLFLESGMEIAVGGWTSTFVNEELAVGPQKALIILSLYWLGMMMGRMTLGTVLRNVRPVSVMFGCIAIGLAGTVLLLFTHNVAAAVIGVFMLGVGFAAAFPTVLGFVGERYAALSGTAFSLVIAIALLGGMFLPWLMGVVADRYGMRGSFAIVPVALVILAMLLSILSRRMRASTT